MSTWLYCYLLLVCALSSTCNGANILGLMGATSPSHHIWNSALLHRLAELGHNVTILSVDVPRPTDEVPPNVHYIHLEKAYPMLQDFNLDYGHFIGYLGLDQMVPVYNFGHKTTIAIAKSTGLQTLLDYPDDFRVDLIFYDYSLGPILQGFVHKFGYPTTVGLTAFLNQPTTIDAMFNHFFPAYVPFYATDYSSEMNFWQRMHNTFLFVAETIYRRWIYYPKLNAVMRPFFPKDMPLLEEIATHTSLSMVNAHPVLTRIEPVPMNVIEVGGMHVRDAKPLPRDLEEFVSRSWRGVVMISFGTNMKSSFFTDDQIDAMLDTMRQHAEYGFVWKFDLEYLKNRQLPDNLFASSFLPQSDLLARPEIKVFVTHCGALSVYESVWHGVPMVGVPLYFDQFRNIRRIVQLGIAVRLDFRTMTMRQLHGAIRTVLEDHEMSARAAVLAAQFRDQPMKPLDRAVWWSEYLLRHPNPSLLRSPASKLNTLQANSIDVLLVWWTFLLFLSALTVKLLSALVVKFRLPPLQKLTGSSGHPAPMKSKLN